jgi:tripartite-type tricarboxylate transporter receptor subunit TctC
MQDVVAGQIDAMFSNTATALPQVLSGNVKAFAVTAKHRLAVAPDIPSVDEAGLPGLYFSLWRGHRTASREPEAWSDHDPASPRAALR